MTTNSTRDYSHPDFDPEDGAIFKDVIFELDSNISSSEQSTLKEQLLKYGAKCYDDEKKISSIEHPTHYITNRDKTVGTSYSVMPLWVKAAIRNGFTHDPKFYTPDPSKHFAGLVVATSGIPKRDQEAIFGATIALGGQYRENLTSDVTHLVCLAPEGDMYDEAMGPLFGKIKVLLPHWFDECFKLRRLVPEDAYLFPEPLFIQQQATSTQTSESNVSTAVSSPNKYTDDAKIQKDMEQEDMGPSRSNSTTPTINMEIDTITTSKRKDSTISDKSATDDGPAVYALPTIEALEKLVPKDRFFDGKLIYIHSDVGLTPEIRACLLQHLETAGATVANNFDDTKNHDSVIAIFKYRNSDLFLQVCNRPDIMVANLAWITNTLRRGRVESPLRSICDYPAPYGGIVGMQNLTATISGYKGDARNILFQICTMVGLPCSFNLDHNTTHLICSQRGTAKYCVGKKRNCNIVNHLWLEECYQQWEFKSVADDRYTYFPPNDILQTIVGKTPLTLDNLKPWFNKDTWPAVTPYTPIHLLHRSSSRQQNSPSYTTGLARRPRQAALDATSQLRDVYVPDMNDYQKEQRSSSNHHSPTTSITNVSTDSTGKQQRRPSESSLPSPSAKRFKVGGMKSKLASTKQTAPPPSSSPEKSISKSPSSTSTHQSPKKSSGSSSTEENQKDTDLTEDEEMEDTTSSPSLKQNPPANSPFTFVDKPAKIATTSYTLTKDEEKGIRKLGSALVDDIRKADILIVPDRILRTPKFLCAVNLGKTIVGSQWIKDSIANQEWCDPSAYQIKDTDMEAAHSFDLLHSLVSAQNANQQVGKSGHSHGDWLQGYEVCVLPSAGSAQALKEVVETAGGKLVPVPKRRSKGSSQGNTQGSFDTNQLLALADKKKDQKRKGWDDLLELGVNIYDKELIIVGALRQKISLDEFSLA
ncbi:hypothetical protein BCR42DRAFT_490503 [Absidia repens]|uniref:BRCT domain-containing protein n=1 Tax=Absidia repens TaxID=90262 RepID=A0A1X2IJW4_9FUNG|nr:hypothetical protein BCR42DRAFT_490503 [Absidia repens]